MDGKQKKNIEVLKKRRSSYLHLKVWRIEVHMGKYIHKLPDKDILVILQDVDENHII